MKHKENFILSQDDSLYFKGNKIGDLGRKRLFDLVRTCENPLAKDSVSRKYNIELSGEHWLMASNCTNETYLQSLQWKIVHGIYPSGSSLKKMKIRQSDTCQYCEEFDSLQHFFFDCSFVKCVWDEIGRHIESIANKYIHLSAEKVMFGLGKGEGLGKSTLNKANHLILIGKATISKAKYAKRKNFLIMLDQEIAIRKICLGT